MKSPIVRHFYCSFCLTCVDKDAKSCTNKFCLKEFTSVNKKSYFIEVPIESQIRKFFQRPDFISNISKRFQRFKKNDQNIEDIYDAEMYSKLCSGDGPLSSKFPYNLSFTLNADGVPVFKSSKMSLWPVYLVVNELPFKLRKRRENMILCGLWFGDIKPFMQTFTQPLFESLKCMEKGIEVVINNKTETCQGYLICMTADLPAKSALLNLTQFNGSNGCFHCLQPGFNHRTEKGGNIHVYPYKAENPTGPRRTHEQCTSDAHEAFITQKSVNGIKGPSLFLALPAFDFVRSVSVDYMHAVLQGITKLLISLWFGSVHADEPFSLYTHVDVADERLSKIKPPSTITRMPRSISQHFKYWKASELRSWLFFYSVPILMDIMTAQYLYHYVAFVESVFLLCSESVSAADLLKAQTNLNFFVYMFKTLYGEKYCTLNLHSLLHLPQCVQDIGPLWVHSCFAFENANGELLKLFHGTQYIDVQIVNALNMLQTLPTVTNLVTSDSQVYKFVCSLTNHTDEQPHLTVCRFMGKGYTKNLSALEYNLVCDVLGYRPDLQSLIFHNRILFRGQVYQSTDYTRVQQRNSFTVKYTDSSGNVFFGQVCWYANFAGNAGLHEELCCVHKLDPVSLTSFGKQQEDYSVQNFLGLTLKHIHSLKTHSSPNDKAIIHVDSILGLCVCVCVEEKLYICDSPNTCETNM